MNTEIIPPGAGRDVAADALKSVLAEYLHDKETFAGAYIGTYSDGGSCVVLRRVNGDMSVEPLDLIMNGVPVIGEDVGEARPFNMKLPNVIRKNKTFGKFRNALSNFLYGDDIMFIPDVFVDTLTAKFKTVVPTDHEITNDSELNDDQRNVAHLFGGTAAYMVYLMEKTGLKTVNLSYRLNDKSTKYVLTIGPEEND